MNWKNHEKSRKETDPQRKRHEKADGQRDEEFIIRICN